MLDFFEYVSREHNKMDEEWSRLKQDIPSNVSTGDRVLVAAGLVGRGHMWIRKEADVVEVNGGSVKVDFGPVTYKDGNDVEWIDRALIVGIIKKES